MSKKEIFARKKIVMTAVLVLILALMTGFIQARKNIQIIADGNTITVNSIFSNPKKIMQQAGITLEEKDEYRLSTKKLEDHTVITVYRAVPVTVTYKGTSNEVITGKPTVGELLADLGIDEEMVRVEPGLDTKITKDVQIKVVEITEKTMEREEEQPYQVIRQKDPSMETGNEILAQEGKNGLKKVTVKVHYDDGVQVSEEVLEEKIIEPAKPEIIKVGTRDTVSTSRGTMRFRSVAHMEATAYLPSDGGGSGITATGIQATHGVIAVDPDVIPLGTRVYIPGYGVAIAADTGGAIQGNIVDLCMEDYGEALSFGRRTVKVYILD